MGDFVVLRGGRGEFRRIERKLRGCVYGSLLSVAGIVVRRRVDTPPGVIGVFEVD